MHQIKCASFSLKRRGCTETAEKFFVQEDLGPVALCSVCAKRELKMVEDRKRFFKKNPELPNPKTRKKCESVALSHVLWGKAFEMTPISKKEYLELMKS